MDVFRDYAYYYNAFYKDKNYADEAKTVSKLLKKYGTGSINRVFDMGCGTGRHDLELWKSGYQVHGMDLSDTMVKIAREQVGKLCGEGLSFEVGDICKCEIRDVYDGVISLFHVMSYQTDNDALLKAFRTAASALKEQNGVFVFDAWYGPGVLSDLPCVRVKKVEDERNILIRHASPVMDAQKNTVDVNYEVVIIDKETAVAREIKETHKMRYLFTPEVAFLLEMAGFELLDCIDCNRLDAADYNSWTVYFIARKR